MKETKNPPKKKTRKETKKKTKGNDNYYKGNYNCYTLWNKTIFLFCYLFILQSKRAELTSESPRQGVPTFSHCVLSYGSVFFRCEHDWWEQILHSDFIPKSIDLRLYPKQIVQTLRWSYTEDFVRNTSTLNRAHAYYTLIWAEVKSILQSYGNYVNIHLHTYWIYFSVCLFIMFKIW